MSIIKLARKTQNFAIIDKALLENQGLSLKAKGLLAYLLSRPDDWQVQVHQLTQSSKDGRDSIYSALKELKAAGYISRERIKNEKGQIESCDYVVYEKPNVSEVLDPHPGFPDMDNPDLVFPDLEKPTQLSNEITKKENNKDRQTNKEPSACSFSDEVIGDTLTPVQVQQVAEGVEHLREEGLIQDSYAQDLLGQIHYSLLDKSAFTQTGVDFAFKLNSILKVVRSGKWQCPKGYRDPGISLINQKHKEIVRIRGEISAVQRLLNSYKNALTSPLAQDPSYRKSTENNMTELSLKIEVLKEKLEEVEASST